MCVTELCQINSCCHWLVQFQPHVAVGSSCSVFREAEVSQEQDCALSEQKDASTQFKWWSWFSWLNISLAIYALLVPVPVKSCPKSSCSAVWVLPIWSAWQGENSSFQSSCFLYGGWGGFERCIFAVCGTVDRQNVRSLDRLRFIKICPGPCWSLSVLLKKMDGSAEPMLLPVILIQATAFPYPAIALTSKLSGVMDLCIASLGGGCNIFCSLSTRHVTGMGSGSCCMFNAVRCFCLQGLHSLPGSSCCPATVMQGKEAFPGSSCQVLGGWPCVKGSQDLVLPCHPESCSGVKWARGVWGAAAQCVESLVLIKS